MKRVVDVYQAPTRRSAALSTRERRPRDRVHRPKKGPGSYDRKRSTP